MTIVHATTSRWPAELRDLSSLGRGGQEASRGSQNSDRAPLPTFGYAQVQEKGRKGSRYGPQAGVSYSGQEGWGRRSPSTSGSGHPHVRGDDVMLPSQPA